MEGSHGIVVVLLECRTLGDLRTNAFCALSLFECRFLNKLRRSALLVDGNANALGIRLVLDLGIDHADAFCCCIQGCSNGICRFADRLKERTNG